MAGKLFVLITTLGLGGCLGRNPLLDECGERWVIGQGAVMDTCATGLGEPFYAGRCKLSDELCFGDQTETSTDSGGTDSGGTSDTGGVVEPLGRFAR